MHIVVNVYVEHRAFNVYPPEIKSGDTVTIRWDVENADEVVLDPPGAQTGPSESTFDMPQTN